MKKTFTLIGIATALALSGSNAFASSAAAAFGPSITTTDKNGTSKTLTQDKNNPQNGPGGYGNHEDQETENNPSTYTDQVWDLEGMYLKGNTLTMVGGFNFLHGTDWSGYDWKGGDIFINTTGTAYYGSDKYGTTNNPTGNKDDYTAVGGGSRPNGITPGPVSTRSDTTTNVNGWDYVIHFNSVSINNTDYCSYTVYALTPQSIVSRVLDVPSSNPWRYVSGGTQVGQTHVITSSEKGTLQNNGVNSSGYYNDLTTYGSTTPGLLGGGVGGNTHYFLSVDISFLPAGYGFNTFHYTVECGNDTLVGLSRQQGVPDTSSTLMMFGGALLGLVGLRRKLQR